METHEQKYIINVRFAIQWMFVARYWWRNICFIRNVEITQPKSMLISNVLWWPKSETIEKQTS